MTPIRPITITGASPVNYTYDANGNITGMNDKVLTYNQNNRLIRVEEDGNTLGEYTYNGLGQRVVKQVGANTIYFIYDFEGKLISEAALDGTVTVSYLYMGENRMARVDSGTGKFFYYLNDSLGTPQMLTDETNTVVWEGLYKPFGKAEVNPNSTVENNFRFPGQYYDSETGLHYNYHRYYDPKAGRYLRPDPIGVRGGIGLYSYCQNNPINITDFKGLDPDDYFYGVDYKYPATGRYRLRFHQEPIPSGIAKWLKDTFEIYIEKKKKKPVLSFAISKTSIYVDTRVRKEQVYYKIHKESFSHKEIARIPFPGSEIWLCESEPRRKVITAEYFPLLPDKIIVDEKELEALLNAIDEDPSWLTLFVLLHEEK